MKRRVDVGDPSVGSVWMAAVDRGAGAPIVFVHGNPTSSFVWRHIIPRVEHLGRCVAPDLIGFGDSDKLPGSGPDSGRFVEHREYLDRGLDALGVDDGVVLVLHDWGSGLGFDWARRHADRVAGVAYLEAIVAPRGDGTNSVQTGEPSSNRSESAAGEQLVLDDNAFIERGLPGGVIRNAHRRRARRVPTAVRRAGGGTPGDAHLAAGDPVRR